jgi:hypothetical protein
MDSVADKALAAGHLPRIQDAPKGGVPLSTPAPSVVDYEILRLFQKILCLIRQEKPKPFMNGRIH